MAVTLAPNQYPEGTHTGSPIEVVDLFTLNGQTTGTAGVPISAKAKPNDVILAFFGAGAAGTTPGPDNISSFVLSPLGVLSTAVHVLDTAPTTAAVEEYLFTHVVRANDPGTTVDLHWTASHFDSWGLAVWCLRFVNTSSIFGGSIGTNASAGNANHSPTNAVSSTVDNAMMVGAFCVIGGSATTGIASGPVSAWYNTDVGKGQQINFGMMSGEIDMALASTFQGADCQWFQPSGTLIQVGFASIVAPIAPTPAPSAPSFYLNPAAGSLDAAGTSGRQLTAYWGYTPVNGQGKQLSWLFVRQTTGGSITQFWNGDINGWVSSEYWNYGSISSYTFPTGAWLDDNTAWNCWMAVTEDALFLKSALAGPVTFATLAPPAVTGVTVTNPVTTTPTINWTEALTNTPQVAYRVRVFSSDQLALPGFDPSNMLVDDDSDFELSIGTWTGAGSTVQLGAAHNFTGGGDLFMQALGTTGVGAFSGSYPVTPGVAYRSIAYSWADATPRSMTLRIIWQDANGNQIATSSGTPATDSTTVWTQLTVAGTAPTGAVTARIFAFSTVSAVNEVHRLDQVHFSATPQPKWASGVVLSTALSATTAALAPSLQYTAYVEVLQTNDQWTPVAAVTNGAYVNNPTATWFAGLTAAPVPTPAALTAVVGG